MMLNMSEITVNLSQKDRNSKKSLSDLPGADCRKTFYSLKWRLLQHLSMKVSYELVINI